MVRNGDKATNLDDRVQPVRSERHATDHGSVPTNSPTPGRITLPAPIHAPLTRNYTSYALETAEGIYYVRQCGPLDAATLAAWTDSVMHKDYFFRRGHWAGLCKCPTAQVYAIAFSPPPGTHVQEIVGIAVLYHDTTLCNLYIDPAWRHRGLGATILQILNPETIRAKTDSHAGDPTPFYERMGYTTLQEQQGPNGTIRIMQRKA